MIVLLAACSEPEPVRLDGVIYSAPGPDAPPLPSARVTFVDATGAILDEAEAGPDGVFRAHLPAGTDVFAEIRGEGYATTTFPGVIGLATPQRVEEHALYGVTVEERDALSAQYTGCAGAEPGAAVVTGEVRLYGWVDEDGVSPIVTTATAEVYQGPKTSWPGCYLDPESLLWDPDAEATGDAGAFAVFGAEPGAHTLLVGYEVYGGAWSYEEYPVWIPDEDGVVSPWYPAGVELIY